MKKALAIWIFFSFFFVCKTFSQSDDGLMPKIIEKDGRHALLVDGKPFFMLGGQAHNSSAWPAMMPSVWTAIQKMHANTLEVPIYWEQVEPIAGQFDFSLIDTLLIQAREHKIRLVLLWFATWKNGSSHYMPEWMKREPNKFPNQSGLNGKLSDSPSPNFNATLEADKKAFAAVMKFLKKADTMHTVIMMQVENEPGSWGSVRDYSASAQKLFEGPVPAELLKPDLLKSLNHEPAKSGSWQKIFGEDADEYFQAWSVARFIDQVAASGKAEYGLPMYINVALRDPLTHPKATNYESGGATDNVIPLWKVAAPHIDLLAPDIYLPGTEVVLKVLELYHRVDNPLFVPEIAFIPENLKYLYSVLGFGGIGYSPFGIDDNGHAKSEEETTEKFSSIGAEYQIAGTMMSELAAWSFEDKIRAIVEKDDHAEQALDLGSWKAEVTFGTADRNVIKPNTNSIGRAMFVKLSPDQFLITATNCHITFSPSGANEKKAWQYLKVEEGYYENGTFHLLRIRNGDETDWGGPRFDNKPVLVRIALILR